MQTDTDSQSRERLEDLYCRTTAMLKHHRHQMAEWQVHLATFAQERARRDLMAMEERAA